MSTKWILYWISVLDSFSSLFTILFWTTFITFIISGILAFTLQIDRDRLYETDEEKEREDEHIYKYFKVFKKSGILALVLSVLMSVLPTKKEMYLIYFGGETIDYILENKEINVIPDKTFKYINKYLDEKLEDNTIKKDTINE